jgi:superfamily II DNA or RNA helicase
MSKEATLKILDEVNVKFDGLDPSTRRKISDACKYFMPYARHTPLFKLGRWDGYVNFATVGGGTYLNLLEQVLPIVVEEGYDLKLDDRRVNYNFDFKPIGTDFLSDTLWPEGHRFAGEPIMLREDQVEAVNRYLANPHGIQCLSTGFGKTILSATLSKIVEPYGRSIVIVPSKTLVEQTEEDFKNIGLDAGVFFGDRKEWNKTHTICTWQSLSVLTKKTRRDEVECTIHDFLDGVIAVQVDECHGLKANELRDVMCGPMANVPIRWGMTGTIPKQDFERVSLQITIGGVVGEVRAKELQDAGFLSKCEINILQTEDDHVSFAAYDKEYKFLTSDEDRLRWIGELANSLEGNTLVLVNRIETGKSLTAMIDNAVFVSGGMKTKARKEEFKDTNQSDNKTLVATFGVMSTGVNIPKIHNLILVECGKSFERTIQSVGRVLRRADGKSKADIYDVCSTLKFSKKHLTERKKYYKEAEYPFKITKVKYNA